VNIARAREAGMTAATIRHPWNEHLAGEDGVVVAKDWPELERRLEPLLAGRA
jgi:hypothetical protein